MIYITKQGTAMGLAQYKQSHNLPVNEKLPHSAWPGGYPIYYVDGGGNVLCPKCANENDDYSEDITAHDINWEDDSLYCDHCSEQIESAYGEDNE